LLKQLGEREEARRLYDEVIAGRTESLGASHTDTLMAKMNLATLLHDLGEREEAKRLFDEVIAGYTESLGASHTSTLGAKNNLAILLKQLGELAILLKQRRMQNTA